MLWISQLLPRRLLQAAFRGDDCYCPICNSHTRSFAKRGHPYPIIDELSIVGAGRRAVDCRVCGSSDRDRLLWEYLSPCLQKSQQKISILHIAPELPIAKAIQQNKNIDYIAVDKHTKGYFYPRWVKQVDIQEAFTIQPSQVDFILCGHVLEHVDQDGLAIKQLIQKLKPHGKLIISVPIAEKLETTREMNTAEWLQLPAEEKIWTRRSSKIVWFRRIKSISKKQ
jgi:SAM-dependent methyltransferase